MYLIVLIKDHWKILVAILALVVVVSFIASNSSGDLPNNGSSPSPGAHNRNRLGAQQETCNYEECFPCDSAKTTDETTMANPDCGVGSCVPKDHPNIRSICSACNDYTHFCSCSGTSLGGQDSGKQNPSSPIFDGDYPKKYLSASEPQACSEDIIGRTNVDFRSQCEIGREEYNRLTKSSPYNIFQPIDSPLIINQDEPRLLDFRDDLPFEPGPSPDSFHADQYIGQKYDYRVFEAKKDNLRTVSCDSNSSPILNSDLDQLFHNYYCKTGELSNLQGVTDSGENINEAGINLNITDEYLSSPSSDFKIPLTYSRINMPRPDSNPPYVYSGENNSRYCSEGEQLVYKADKDTNSSPMCTSNGVELPFECSNKCFPSSLEDLNSQGYIFTENDYEIIKAVGASGTVDTPLSPSPQCSSPNFKSTGRGFTSRCDTSNNFVISGCRGTNCSDWIRDHNKTMSSPYILLTEPDTPCSMSGTNLSSPCQSVCHSLPISQVSCNNPAFSKIYEEIGCDMPYDPQQGSPNNIGKFFYEVSTENIDALVSGSEDRIYPNKSCCRAKTLDIAESGVAGADDVATSMGQDTGQRHNTFGFIGYNSYIEPDILKQYNYFVRTHDNLGLIQKVFHKFSTQLEKPEYRNKYLNHPQKQIDDKKILGDGGVIEGVNKPPHIYQTCGNKLAPGGNLGTMGLKWMSAHSTQDQAKIARAFKQKRGSRQSDESADIFCNDPELRENTGEGREGGVFLYNKKYIPSSPLTCPGVTDGGSGDDECDPVQDLKNITKQCCHYPENPINVELNDSLEYSTDSTCGDAAAAGSSSAIRSFSTSEQLMDLDEILGELNTDYLGYDGERQETTINVDGNPCFQTKTGYACDHGLSYTFSSPNTLRINSCNHFCQLNQDEIDRATNHLHGVDQSVTPLTEILNASPNGPLTGLETSPRFVDIIPINKKLSSPSSGIEIRYSDLCAEKGVSQCYQQLSSSPCRDEGCHWVENNQGGYCYDKKNWEFPTRYNELLTLDPLNYSSSMGSIHEDYHGPLTECSDGSAKIKGCDLKFKADEHGIKTTKINKTRDETGQWDNCSKYIEYINSDNMSSPTLPYDSGSDLNMDPPLNQIPTMCSNETNVLFANRTEATKYCADGYYPVNPDGENTHTNYCENLNQNECYSYKDCNWDGEKCNKTKRAACVQLAEPGSYYSDNDGYSYIKNFKFNDQTINKNVELGRCADPNDTSTYHENTHYETLIISSPPSSPPIYKSSPPKLIDITHCNNSPLFTNHAINLQNLPDVLEESDTLKFKLKKKDIATLNVHKINEDGSHSGDINFLNDGLSINRNTICKVGSILQAESDINSLGDDQEINLVCASCPPLENQADGTIPVCGYTDLKSPDVNNLNKLNGQLNGQLNYGDGENQLKGKLLVNNGINTDNSQAKLCVKGYTYSHKPGNTEGKCVPNRCSIPYGLSEGVVQGTTSEQSKFGGETTITQSRIPIGKDVIYNPSSSEPPLGSPPHGYFMNTSFDMNTHFENDPDKYYCSGNPDALRNKCDILHNREAASPIDPMYYLNLEPTAPLPPIVNAKQTDNILVPSPQEFTASPCYTDIDPTSYYTEMDECLDYSIGEINPFIYIPTAPTEDGKKARLQKINEKMDGNSNLSETILNQNGKCLRLQRSEYPKLTHYFSKHGFSNYRREEEYGENEDSIMRGFLGTIPELVDRYSRTNCQENDILCEILTIKDWNGSREGIKIKDDISGINFDNILNDVPDSNEWNYRKEVYKNITQFMYIENEVSPEGSQNINEGFQNIKEAEHLEFWNFGGPGKSVKSPNGHTLVVKGNIDASAPPDHFLTSSPRCGWTMDFRDVPSPEKKEEMDFYSRICNRTWYRGHGVSDTVMDHYEDKSWISNNYEDSRNNLEVANYSDIFSIKNVETVPTFYKYFTSDLAPEPSSVPADKHDIDYLFGTGKDDGGNIKLREPNIVSMCTSIIKDDKLLCSYNIMDNMESSPDNTYVYTAMDTLKQPYLGHLDYNNNYPRLLSGHNFRNKDFGNKIDANQVRLKYPELNDPSDTTSVDNYPYMLSVNEIYTGSSPSLDLSNSSPVNNYEKQIIPPSPPTNAYQNAFYTPDCLSGSNRIFLPSYQWNSYITNKESNPFPKENGGNYNKHIPADCEAKPGDSDSTPVMISYSIDSSENSSPSPIQHLIKNKCLPQNWFNNEQNKVLNKDGSLSGFCVPCPINTKFSSKTCTALPYNKYSIPGITKDHRAEDNDCPNGYIGNSDYTCENRSRDPQYSYLTLNMGNIISSTEGTCPGTVPGAAVRRYDKRLELNESGQLDFHKGKDYHEYDPRLYQKISKFETCKSSPSPSPSCLSNEEKAFIRNLSKEVIVKSCGTMNPPVQQATDTASGNYYEYLPESSSLCDSGKVRVNNACETLRSDPTAAPVRNSNNQFRTKNMRESQVCRPISLPFKDSDGKLVVMTGSEDTDDKVGEKTKVTRGVTKTEWNGTTDDDINSVQTAKIINKHTVYNDKPGKNGYKFRSYRGPDKCGSCIWENSYPSNFAGDWTDSIDHFPFAVYSNAAGTFSWANKCSDKYNVKWWQKNQTEDKGFIRGEQPGSSGWDDDLDDVHWGTKPSKRSYQVCDLFEDGNTAINPDAPDAATKRDWSYKIRGDHGCQEPEPT